MNNLVKLLLFAALASSCGENSKKKRDTVNPPAPPKAQTAVDEAVVPIAEDTPAPAQPETPPAELIPYQIVKFGLQNHNDLTLFLEASDVQRTRKAVLDGGGEIVYDPNGGVGSSTQFIVVNLPTDKAIEPEFLQSLQISAATIDHPKVSQIRPLAEGLDDVAESSPVVDVKPVYVPLEEVNLSALRNRVPGEALGEGTIIAVIDSGVDVSHPIFGDRVIFSSDETGEGDFALSEVKVDKGFVTVGGKKSKVPSAFKKSPIYAALVDEANTAFISRSATVDGKSQGKDFNGNGYGDDKFAILVGQVGKKWAAVTDLNADGTIDDSEAKKLVLDFNRARNGQVKVEQGESDLLNFPSRSRRIAFPLTFKMKDKKPVKLNIASDFNGHGTHVAGIAAGDGKTIKGAAPKAKIMAIKACCMPGLRSGIMKAIIRTVQNEQGLVPDVVNVSLGLDQRYTNTIAAHDKLMADLSAKFGTTFFIAASNSGPGHRTLNAWGAAGPLVQVGAYVSKKTRSAHYGMSPKTDVPEHMPMSFTSLGPSYTGEMKPNIMAPGSAVSGVPLRTSQKADMYAGTSMASPLAAGASAALISLVKHQNKMSHLTKFMLDKKSRIREGKTSSGSLSFMPLAIRTSLEDTASRIENTPLVQQGHGLIDINKAYDKFVEIIEKKDQLQLLDFQINSNNYDRKAYHRDLTQRRINRFRLSLANDGELTDSDKLAISTQPLKIKLVELEVESSEGKVSSLDLANEKTPIYISVRGETNTRSLEKDLMLSTSWGFDSVRLYEEMQPGSTYTAHFAIYSGKQRLFSLLDVVHVPIEVSHPAKTYDLPYLFNGALKSKKSSWAVANRPIAASGFHRYPIAVSKSDSVIKLSFAIHPDKGGNIDINVLDQDGMSVARGWAAFGRETPFQKQQAVVQVPTKKSGIYQVVVSNAWDTLMHETSYDFLIEKIRFSASRESLMIEEVDQTLTFDNSSEHSRAITKIGVSSLNVGQLYSMSVKPYHITYQRIHLPKTDSTNDLSALSFQLFFPEEMNDIKVWNFNLDQTLFRQVDGKFQPITEGVSFNQGTFTVEKSEFEKGIYLGVRTYDYVNLKEPKPTVIGLEYTSLSYEGDDVLSIANETVSERGFLEYRFKAKRPFKGLAKEQPVPTFLMGDLEVETNNKDVKASIPVKITP